MNLINIVKKDKKNITPTIQKIVKANIKNNMKVRRF